MKKFGIDISKWQGDFNLQQAKNEGVEFVIIKGAGGDWEKGNGLYTDSKFVRNYDEAKRLGLPVGAYFYSNARTVEKAVIEAEYFYNNCLKGRKFELPVWYDVEEKGQLDLGKRLVTDIIKAFCNYLEAKGYWVGIYSSKSYFGTYMFDNELQRYSHWLASWSKTCTYPNPAVFGMWQFGGSTNAIRSTIVAGVTCDQNYMLIDYPSIIPAAGLNGFPKTGTTTPPPVITPPVKKTIDQVAREIIDGINGWGNGTERINKLREHGYDPTVVQAEVNRIIRERTKPTTPPPVVATVKVGSIVMLKPGCTDYTGRALRAFLFARKYRVSELNRDRAVITYGGSVIAAVKVENLILQS